ncbi:MAG: hypothetical protein HQK96_16780, partial [Nitrospirae bacterium]|nr:hypothetical protein [Nitrospirota bacterium]
GRDYIEKANKKKKQLDAVDAEIKIILCVINSTPMIGLNTAIHMDKHAEYLYNELNWGPNYYVGLLTDYYDYIANRTQDTIFPELN